MRYEVQPRCTSNGGGSKNLHERCAASPSWAMTELIDRYRMRSLSCFLRRFAAGASRCLSAKLRIRRRTGSRRRDSRGLELKCVPQRAGNGCARGPALETRDPENLCKGRAAGAPRNALEPRGTGAPIRRTGEYRHLPRECIRRDGLTAQKAATQMAAGLTDGWPAPFPLRESRSEFHSRTAEARNCNTASMRTKDSWRD